MAKISPTAAAKRWHKSKTTIYKMMKDGEISYSLNEKEKRVLETSELVRVMGEPERTVQTGIDAMQQQVQRQHDELVQVLKSQVKDQAEQLKTLTSAMDRFALLLEHQNERSKVGGAGQEGVHPETINPTPSSEMTPTPQSIPKPAKRKRSFLQRVLSAAIED